jgi:hypothetical protein
MNGVITGGNIKFAPTLEAMALSLQEQGISLLVKDHGLGQPLRDKLAGYGAIVEEDYTTYSTSLKDITRASGTIPKETWIKPLLCLSSPFERSLWLDADTVPLRDTHKLFEKGSFVTRDHFIPQSLAEYTGRLLARALNKQFIAKYSRINAGVIGFCPADPWLAEWARLCAEIIQDRKLTRLCVGLDQSVLVTVLCERTLPMPRLLRNSAMNYPVDGFGYKSTHSRLEYPADGKALLAMVRERHQRQLVVHWMGPNKRLGRPSRKGVA